MLCDLIYPPLLSRITLLSGDSTVDQFLLKCFYLQQKKIANIFLLVVIAANDVFEHFIVVELTSEVDPRTASVTIYIIYIMVIK